MERLHEKDEAANSTSRHIGAHQFTPAKVAGRR